MERDESEKTENKKAGSISVERSVHVYSLEAPWGD